LRQSFEGGGVNLGAKQELRLVVSAGRESFRDWQELVDRNRMRAIQQHALPILLACSIFHSVLQFLVRFDPDQIT